MDEPKKEKCPLCNDTGKIRGVGDATGFEQHGRASPWEKDCPNGCPVPKKTKQP